MELLIATSINRQLRTIAIALWGAKHITEEYVSNKKHYHDLIRFNFLNSETVDLEVGTRVQPGHLPQLAAEQVRGLYNRYVSQSMQDIHSILNIPLTDASKYSPLEKKYTFEYFKKYNTFEYQEKNVVTDHEILTPLSQADYIACNKNVF